MQRVLSLAPLLACLLLFPGFQASQGQPPPATQQSEPFKVQVVEVNVLLTAVDKHGLFVTDLKADNFILTEDKVQQTITNFRKEQQLPLTIALMMDTSASVRLQLEFEKRVAASFLTSVMRADDKALLAEFDTGTSLLRDFTDRPGPIIEDLRTLRSGGGTALFDALCRVSEEKLGEPADRKVIVLVSDGADRHSKKSIEEAIEAVQRADAVVYAVGTSKFGASGDKSGEPKLKTLAELTGGRAFFPYSEEQFSEAFAQINDELRSQYSLTYVPTNKRTDGRFRELKVKVKGVDDVTVRHKKGYYAPSS